MTHAQALAEILEILSKHVEPGRVVKPTDDIQVDLGLDSLGVMEVIADVEDRYDLRVPNERLADVVTVDDVAKLLVELKKG